MDRTTLCRTASRLSVSPLVRVVALATTMGLASGCELPTAPSDPEGGVQLFAREGFEGRSVFVTRSVSDLDDLGNGPCDSTHTAAVVAAVLAGGGDVRRPTWDDCVASIRLAPGWRVTLYEHPDFDGRSFSSSVDIASVAFGEYNCEAEGAPSCLLGVRLGLSQLKERISSIRVFPPDGGFDGSGAER